MSGIEVPPSFKRVTQAKQTPPRPFPPTHAAGSSFPQKSGIFACVDTGERL